MNPTVQQLKQRSVLGYHDLNGEIGALGAIRTRGLSLRRRMLYPAELQAHALIYKGF